MGGVVVIAQPWERPEGGIEELSSVSNTNLNSTEAPSQTFTTQTKSLLYQFSALVGTLLCLISVLGNSIATVSIRGLGKHVHYWILTCTHAMFGTVIVLPIWLLLDLINLKTISTNGIQKYDLIMLLCISICGTFAQISKKLALDNERSVIVQMVGNLQIVFSYILQYFILGNVPNGWSVVGAVLISVSVFGLGFVKMFGQKEDKK